MIRIRPKTTAKNWSLEYKCVGSAGIVRPVQILRDRGMKAKVLNGKCLFSVEREVSAIATQRITNAIKYLAK